MALALRVRVVRSTLRHLVMLVSSSHWNWRLACYVLIGHVVARHSIGAVPEECCSSDVEIVCDISRRNTFSQRGGFALLFLRFASSRES